MVCVVAEGSAGFLGHRREVWVWNLGIGILYVSYGMRT
jgi:hypothetical protein